MDTRTSPVEVTNRLAGNHGLTTNNCIFCPFLTLFTDLDDKSEYNTSQSLSTAISNGQASDFVCKETCHVEAFNISDQSTCPYVFLILTNYTA